MKMKIKKCLAVLLAIVLVMASISNGVVNVFASDIKDEEKTEINNGINLKSKGVKVNLFDYNIKEGAEWEYYNYYNFKCVVNDKTRAWAKENEIKENQLFLFGGNRQYSSSVYGAQNAWTGEKGGVYQGIVSKELKDGKLQFSGNSGEGEVYGIDLFPEQEEVKALDYVKGYYDVDFLFNVDQDGYYNFNSDKHMASNLKLGQDGNYNLDFDFNQAGPIFSSVTGTDKRNCGFFPFNSYTEVISGEGAESDTEVEKIYKAKGERNHLFGMELGFDFFMPKEGIFNEKEMVFKFSGDDDVWVYIDGKLALDLGGIHDATGGEINFATGEITYYRVYNKETGKTQEKTVSLKDDIGFDNTAYKKHNLKMYYLERGESDSNCSLNFNMPVFPEGESISIHKEVTGLNKSIGVDNEYQFIVLYGDDKGAVEAATEKDMANSVKQFKGSYDIYSSGIEGEKKEATDGIIEVKAEQTATLSIPRGNYYKVIELKAGDYNTKWSIDSDDEKEFQKGNGMSTSTIYSNDQKYFIVFINEYQDETGNLVLRKVLEKDNNSEETFYFQVYLNGKKYNNEPIALKNGEAYTINNLPYNTIFTIEEILNVEQAEKYDTPKVTVSTSGSAIQVTGSAINASGEAIVEEEKEDTNVIFKFTGVLKKNCEIVDVSGEENPNNNTFEVIIEYLNTVKVETPEPTETPKVTETPEPTETPEVTETPEPTETPEVTETPGPTETPVETPEPTETPKVPDPTETPEPTETPVETPEPTETPVETPEPTETPVKTPEPTETPVETPEPTETPVETPEPTETPVKTPEPTETPVVPDQTETPKVPETPKPTGTPIIIPTQTPPGGDPDVTPGPSDDPIITPIPSEDPTGTPIVIPTQIPPGGAPTIKPTAVPIMVPTPKVPEGNPSVTPTKRPTVTVKPNKVPNALPQTGGLAGLSENTKVVGIGMFALLLGCMGVIVYRRRSQK